MTTLQTRLAQADKPSRELLELMAIGSAIVGVARFDLTDQLFACLKARGL